MTLSLTPQPVKDLNAERLAAFSAERSEPAWLLALRLEALQNFLSLPWPSEKDEHWKRTHLDETWLGLPWTNSPLAALESEASLPAVYRRGDEAGNGSAPARFAMDLARGYVRQIPEALRERNVRWLSLDEAVRQFPDRIEPAWKRSIERARGDKFASLSLALGHAGTCLIVPKGHVVKAPFQSVVGLDANPSAAFVLNFVFLEEAAEAHLWEELSGEEASGDRFVTSYLSMDLRENAKISCYYVQNWDERTAHIQYQDVTQEAFSRFNAIAVSTGARVFHNETQVHLQGTGAENKVLGLLFGDRSQNFVNWITQNHTATRTTSDIQYRGALKGSAHSFFSGMVSITKEAQQSDAFQSAKSLLLSQDARADAIPNLEILADDVKCSHGAAVGPVDEDQKYYLQTRGIAPDDAEEIIVQGFFEPVIAELPSPAVQERLRAFVEKKLRNV